MSKLFNILRDVLTPYANKINLHTEEIEEIQSDVSEVKADLGDVYINASGGSKDSSGNTWIEYSVVAGRTYKITNASDRAISANTVPSMGSYQYIERLGTIQAGADYVFTVTLDAPVVNVYCGGASSWTIVEQTSIIEVYKKTLQIDDAFGEIDTLTEKVSLVETMERGLADGLLLYDIQGSFVLGNTGNGSLIVSSTNNMITADVQTVTDDCVLTTDWSKYKVYIWQVENNTWNGLGWIFADHMLSAGFSGRFVVRGVTTHDFTTAEQEEINNVTVYKRTTTLKNRIDSIDIGKSDFISICHQGYSDSMSTNQDLLPGFKAAAEHGFDYAETDVALSSNNVVMCCHDSSFVDATTGNTIVIAEHTDVELKTYNYYGGTIATLDEIMSACKTNRIGLVIDHATNSLLPYIYPIVSKYGMQDSVIYLIGWAVGNENYAKNMYNSIIAFYKRSKVMFMAGTSSLSEVKTFLNTLDTGFATVYITLNHANYPVADIIALTQELPGEITVAVWTIDSLPTAKSYMPYVTAITSNKYSSRDIFA